MEQETILYYYPMPEQLAKTENRYAAKQHWFQEASLKTAVLAHQTEFQILGCAIPPFYYRHRPWKPQMLSRMMETVLGDAAGMTDTWVHPGTEALLTDEYRMKWAPHEETARMLVKHLLDEYAGETLKRCGMVTVLLGQSDDADRQMEMTWELLQPFLPRVNRMLIYYERRESAMQEDYRESPELEEYAALNQYLEEYYYEYGLVPQLEAYTASYAADGKAVDTDTPYPFAMPVPRCGKAKCGGVILDYCGQFRYPKILPEGGIYMDTVSAWEKERLIRRKSLSIPYLSPLKYLDTMVKNSYDSKVKKGEEIF